MYSVIKRDLNGGVLFFNPDLHEFQENLTHVFKDFEEAQKQRKSLVNSSSRSDPGIYIMKAKRGN